MEMSSKSPIYECRRMVSEIRSRFASGFLICPSGRGAAKAIKTDSPKPAPKTISLSSLFGHLLPHSSHLGNRLHFQGTCEKKDLHTYLVARRIARDHSLSKGLQLVRRVKR